MPPPTPTQLRRDLRAILLDGASFSVMVGSGETYLAPFVLAVGLGEVQAGFIASLPPLAGAILQLASPAAVRRLGSHRRWVVLCALIQAASFLPLIAAALLGRIPAAAAFLIATIYWGAGMSTGPAWNTWVGTLVPRGIRAVYFARRTRVTQAGTVLGLVVGGSLLAAGKAGGWEMRAYAALFALAGACRFLSAAYLASQSEPVPMPSEFRHVPARELLANLRRSHEGKLLGYMLAVQMAVQISAPFFSPYWLKQLHLSYEQYMALVAVSFLSRIAVMPAFGALARRFSARNLLWCGGIAITPMASLWLVSDWFPYLVVVQILAGIAWGAWELATFLLVFETIREEERTSILTTFNLANALAMVAGSLVGGAILHHLGEEKIGYLTIFALSSSVRLLTLPLLRRVPNVRLLARPIATRTVALRAGDAASDDRPVLPSIDEEQTPEL
jgi:MFS family permease